MKKMVDGRYVDLSPEEIQEFNDRQIKHAGEVAEREKQRALDSALKAKWESTEALVDDILRRGPDVVKTEREAIKAANPKTKEKK
jgi:hypothetical protein